MRCIKKVYGIVPSLYYRDRNKNNKKWSNIWVAKISRKEVYNDLSIYGFGGNNWKIPKEIENSNNENIIGSFLKGFYDSEGSVSKGIRSFNISVHSNSHEGILGIKSLLEKLEIETSKMMEDVRPNRNSTFYFFILRKNSVKRFLNKVGFSIQRKQDKLKKYIK